MKRDQAYNLLAMLSLILAAMVALYYSIIFVIPNSPINPFSPIELPIAASEATPDATSTLNPPEATFFATVTADAMATATASPTASLLPVKPSPTITFTQMPTRSLTGTQLPTARPTASITPTPDICSTLKLLAPSSGQHYNQNDTADLTWTFGRALSPDEHFNVLLDPPGQGIGSIAWADELQPQLKSCLTRCIYQVGLGRYPGGRFNWTIGVIKAGANHQVSAQICKPPDPNAFTYLTFQ